MGTIPYRFRAVALSKTNFVTAGEIALGQTSQDARKQVAPLDSSSKSTPHQMVLIQFSQSSLEGMKRWRLQTALLTLSLDGSDLRLELELSAPDHPLDAALYLRILQTYASVAEACGNQLGIEILEVQGERLHLFLELTAPTPNIGLKLIEFSRLFHALASQRIAEEAPGYQFTLRFAADYGRALIVRTADRDLSDSVISLGDVANRPAKRLVVPVGRDGVAAGYLSVTASAVGESSKGEPKWFDIDVASWAFLESARNDTFERSKAVLANVEIANRRLVEASIAPNPLNLVGSPRFRQGFMLRADLDGFSARVRSAFSDGDYGLQKLVEEFCTLIDYPKHFADKLPGGVQTVVFPWAGDCANLFLTCEDYDSERGYIPNRLGLNGIRSLIRSGKA